MGENYHTHFRNLEKFRITPYSPRTKFKNTQNVNSTDSLKLVAHASFLQSIISEGDVKIFFSGKRVAVSYFEIVTLL